MRVSSTPGQPPFTIDEMCEHVKLFSDNPMIKHHPLINLCFAAGQDSLKMAEKHNLIKMVTKPGEKKDFLILTRVGKKLIELLWQSRAKEFLQKEISQMNPAGKYARQLMIARRGETADYCSSPPAKRQHELLSSSTALSTATPLKVTSSSMQITSISAPSKKRKVMPLSPPKMQSLLTSFFWTAGTATASTSMTTQPCLKRPCQIKTEGGKEDKQ